MKVIQSVGFQKWTVENGLEQEIVDMDDEIIEDDCLYSKLDNFSAKDYTDLFEDINSVRQAAYQSLNGTDYLIHIAIYNTNDYERRNPIAKDSIYESDLLKEIYDDEDIKRLAEEYIEEM